MWLLKKQWEFRDSGEEGKDAVVQWGFVSYIIYLKVWLEILLYLDSRQAAS